MAGPIQLIPAGLLAYFDLKNAGRNPGELVESLQPTLSMFDWYMLNKREQLQFNHVNLVGPALTGSFELFIVPEREVWYVHSIRVFTASTASQLSFSVTYADVRNNGFMGIGKRNIPWRINIGNPQINEAFDGEFFLKPGSSTWINVTFNDSPANRSFASHVTISRLPL